MDFCVFLFRSYHELRHTETYSSKQIRRSHTGSPAPLHSAPWHLGALWPCLSRQLPRHRHLPRSSRGFGQWKPKTGPPSDIKRSQGSTKSACFVLFSANLKLGMPENRGKCLRLGAAVLRKLYNPSSQDSDMQQIDSLNQTGKLLKLILR